MNNDLMDTVLRAILPSSTERYLYTRERLEVEHFTGAHRDLWEIICGVAEVTNGTIVDGKALEKVLEAMPSSKMTLQQRAQVSEVWEHLAQLPSITEPDFRMSVEILIEVNKEEELAQTLAFAGQVLDTGATKGKTRFHGLADALEVLRDGMAKADYVASTQGTEGNVRDEKDELLRELQEGSAIKRIPTGIVPIDEMTNGGPGTGEFWIVGAYTGVGKSLLAINMMHNFITQGANVLYFSLEMKREQVRRRLVVRHAQEEKFGIGGFSLTALNKHRPTEPTLDDEMMERYLNTIDDLTNNPEFGNALILEVPEYTRLSTLKTIAERWQNKMNVDAIIIDSLDLVSSEQKRQNRRDEMNEVILQTKGWAISYNDGAGVPIITPWQTSREAFKQTTGDFSTGKYGITSLAETSEAERRADLIVTLLQKPDTDIRLDAQTLKWRDGSPKDFELKVEYDHCYMGSKEKLNSFGGIDMEGLNGL